ncbi:MAG: ECF-type sigma factor [Pseudomonadota bacterium]
MAAGVMSNDEITALLGQWQAGDASAFADVLPHVHGELRQLAAYYLSSERAGHTLQSTALVNEAYLRLINVDLPLNSRNHFLAIAARVMRQILVDHARSKQRQKRGDGVEALSLDESVMLADQPDPRILEVDEALYKLAAFDARMAKAVELVFFGGLTTQQAADVLEISRMTLSKDLKLAKAWLNNELR